jgi:histidinol-phosphatase (PHP family)
VYCDGIDTLEEMIPAAIEKGFHSVGFSGHSYMHYSLEYGMSLEGTKVYQKEIAMLKKQYANLIDIYCGCELDLYSEVDLDGFDYIIGSFHYFKRDGEYIGFDRSKDQVADVIRRHFDGDGMKYAKAYYEEIIKLADIPQIDIVGHFDLVTKHKESAPFFDADSAEYRKYALEALDVLAKKFPLFELNSGAIPRGYRTTPYLDTFLLKELKKRGCGIVISSDCHNSKYLDCHFKESKKILKACGFEEHYVLKDTGFQAVPISV